MQTNQTAAELAHEYEQMAIAATNDFCRLKRHQPEAGFPAVAKSIGFCTTMHVLWKSVARQLAEGPEVREQNEYWSQVDPNDYHDEYGV